MNTLILCAGSVWQPFISAIPCICWGVLVLIAFYLLLRYVVSPLIANCHERKMKDDNFIQEKYWYFQKELKIDFKKELSDKIKSLEADKDKLSEQLKKEKEDREKKLKEECLQAEYDFYKKIAETFYSKEEKQQK